MDEKIIAEGSVWVDQLPAVANPHRDLFRRLVRVDSVNERYICGVSYWESRGTDPRDRQWKRDRGSRGRPTRILRATFERKFELMADAGGRSAEQMLREQIARDILDYAENHEHSTADPGDAFTAAAHIARGESPHCDCTDRGYDNQPVGGR